MFQLRAYLHVLVAIGLLGAFFFGVHWFALPKDLAKSTAHLDRVEARYIGSKWPQVRFVRDDGTFEQVSCGRVRPLCGSMKALSLNDLNVWFVPSVLGEEPWIVAVESDRQVLLSESEQRAAYADFKNKPAFIACGFLLLSFVGLLLTFCQSRREKPSPFLQNEVSGR